MFHNGCMILCSCSCGSPPPPRAGQYKRTLQYTPIGQQDVHLIEDWERMSTNVKAGVLWADLSPFRLLSAGCRRVVGQSQPLADRQKVYAHYKQIFRTYVSLLFDVRISAHLSCRDSVSNLESGGLLCVPSRRPSAISPWQVHARNANYLCIWKWRPLYWDILCTPCRLVKFCPGRGSTRAARKGPGGRVQFMSVFLWCHREPQWTGGGVAARLGLTTRKGR